MLNMAATHAVLISVAVMGAWHVSKHSQEVVRHDSANRGSSAVL